MLEDELSNAVTDTDFELMLAKVEEEDVDFTAIVGIDNAGTSHKPELDGKAAVRGDTAISALRDKDGELHVN